MPPTTTMDDGLSAYLPAPVPAGGSPGLVEFSLDEGEEDVEEDDDEEEDEEEEEEDGDEEVLSLLQFESRHRVPPCGVVVGCGGGGLELSRPGVWLRSRQPDSLRQPKSGRRMLSMKKFVVRWCACWAPGWWWWWWWW